MGSSSAWPLALGLLAMLASCTLTRKDTAECTTNAECRTAFGAGFTCGGGFCGKGAPNPRCSQTYPEDLLTRPESYPGIITIGSIMDRSVDTQKDREAAIRLATIQVNDAKGLDGHLFGVVQCDAAANSQYDSLKRADAAVADARYLADVLGVPAIVGPSASGDASAVLDALKGTGVLVVSPSASSPDLTKKDQPNPTDDQPGLFWRTVPPDTLQGKAISRYLVKSAPDAKSVVVIDEKGPYGSALAEVFTSEFQKAGRTVKASEFQNQNERDAAIATAPTAPAPAFVLFFSSQTPDAVAFLNSASRLASYDAVQLFLTDSAANTDLLTGVTETKIFPRVTGSRPALPTGPTFDLFKTSYSAAFKKDPSALGFAPQAYDATWMVFYGSAYALRREGALSGIGISRGLRKIATTGPEVPIMPANWSKIADAIGAGTPVNLDGASGKLDYDPGTRETSSPVEIWKVSADHQAIETVTQIDPSSPE